MSRSSRAYYYRPSAENATERRHSQPKRPRLVSTERVLANPLGLVSLAVALAGALTTFFIVSAQDARAQDRHPQGTPPGALRAGEIQDAARRIEAARRGVRAGGDPFEALAEELRETRAVLAGIAVPTSRREGSPPAASLQLRAAQLRRRCDELQPVAERHPSLAGTVSQLGDRCARLLAAIDEILALPDPKSRSERALELLGELAAAGPRARDPRRAPPEPTRRSMEAPEP